jgi:hypothetical protein
MLVFAVWYPNPTPFQVRVFMTALATAAAGVGGMLPGVLTVKYKGIIRASGALALFVVVWFFQPAIEQGVVKLESPSQPPDSVVNDFLADLDSGKVEKAFGELDPALIERTGVNLNTWTQLYDTTRKPLGTVVERKQVGIDGATSPSGLPIGLYRQMTFMTKFSTSSECREEVVITRATQDKQWRVSTYRISEMEFACPASFGASGNTSKKEK